MHDLDIGSALYLNTIRLSSEYGLGATKNEVSSLIFYTQNDTRNSDPIKKSIREIV